MEIQIEDTLSAGDLVSLFEWRDRVFPAEGRGFSWEKPSHHVVARDQGVAIAHIGFGAFRIIYEKEIPVIGVGGVVVRPEHQGKNIPGMLFETLNASTVLDVRRSIVTLFCPVGLSSYYTKHGFETHRHGFEFLQEGNYVETGLFHFMVRGHPGDWEGKISIPSNPW